MSDPTPKPTGVERRSAEARPGLTRGASSLRWWAASLLFHGLLLAWLFLFARGQALDPKGRPAVPQASATRARQVVTEIREKQAASLSQNLRMLEAIRGQLLALEQRKRAEFVAFAGELGQDAPAKAAAELAAIAQAQSEALAALEQAGSNTAHFVRTRANAFFDDLAEAQTLARDQQTRVLQLQEQAESVLSLGDERFVPALAAQSEASAAQDRAAKALVEAETARDPARWSRKRTAHENQIEHFTYHLKRATDTLVNAETNLATARKRLAVAEAVLARRKTAAAQADTRAATENTDAAKLTAEAAHAAVTKAEKDLASAQRRVDDSPKTLAEAQKRLPELQAKVAELLAQPPPEPKPPTPEDEKLLALQTAARQLQLEAQLAQQKAALAAAALQAIRDKPTVGREALAALDKAAPAEPTPAPRDLEHLNLAQLYTSAVATEGALAQSYRRLRALDLAMIRRLPLAKAIRLTEVAKVLRPDLAAELQASITSGQDVPAARQAIQTAKAEVAAMVRLAGSLLSRAQGLERGAGSTLSTEDYNRRFEQWQKMEELAAEDEGQWARDLTGVMGDEAGQGGAGPGDGSEGWGSEGNDAGGRGSAGGGPGGAWGQGPGAGSGTGGSGWPDLGMTGLAGPFDGTGGPGAGGPGGFGRGGIPGASGAEGAPEDVTRKIFPWPGRRIAARGPSPRWLFVDSWYILGPFDNTGRRNLEKKFPPETVIDLNATYPGKNGVPIHWEFHQAGQPDLIPPLDGYNAARHDPSLSPAANTMRSLEYIIYYAYTELWFEEACDLWVAIGSDDFSKLWIEDQLVWTSGKKLKSWRLNEGLRKVHFRQGPNRVLYRVENGNNITEFSLVLSLQP